MATIASREMVTDSPGTEGLTSWWSRFKSKPNRKEPELTRGIFNVPLQESITYANVAISLYNDNGQTFIYGYIPIVVAKCGLFLKDNATETEGIFRLSGSAKRIKDLQAIFDQPPRYGKGLDWTGFTVHDAANILRRYLNHLPDPIIPYDWYDSFREPLIANWPTQKVIVRMQELVASLPTLNRQLLLYILDLLAVFASKAEINRMTSENLSAIFQPGLITHPRDDMAPQEYKLSQEVLVFLIDNQSHFLLDSLCTPSAEPSSEVTTQRKATVTRRRTLQPSKRSPSSVKDEVKTASHPTIHSTTMSPSPVSGRSGSLSRSNTVPSKRNPPSRPSNTEASARYVSSPAVTTPAPAHSAVLVDTPSMQQRVPSNRTLSSTKIVEENVDQAAKSVERLSSETRTPAMLDVSLPAQQQSSQTSPAKHSPREAYPDARITGISSGRTSRNSSCLATEADFNQSGNRKVVSNEGGASSLSSTQRPLSIATTQSLADKVGRDKQGRTTSSSPSKFTNLFRKKPRNQSVSSTSEAGGRRDLEN